MSKTLVQKVDNLSTPKKILIIDDEQDLCALMKVYFSRKNYQVHYTHTLQDGVKEMQNLLPDILFLDNNLPDGIGWMQVETFLKVNPDLKLYLMSGYQPTAPEIPGVQFQVLTKPISFSDLDHL
ncbi:MAG: response regulator [Pseudobacter sp.]|uniref:response regulator n=1 Tax=Pseudobacter sp. TaxID=2045420 RepID=UPI003F810BFE